MRRTLPLLAVLGLAFAPVPKPKPADQVELGRLRGTWVLVSESHCGKPGPAKELYAVFSGRHLDLSTGKESARWEITLDPKASPRAMDQRIPAATKGEVLLLKAAYSLEGDTLKICYDSNDWWARPKDLSGKGPFQHLRVFKRKKAGTE